MKYEHLWADMHSNIHHNQMQDLDRWYQHAKQVMDFWPIAYYPFAIRRTPTGGELEDLIPSEDCARAVSYTHLDVYKRQMRMCSNSHSSWLPFTK